MDELLVKRLPHNVEAEQSVIGAILLRPKCLPDVIPLLKPTDFYMEQHRDIYNTILAMEGKGRTIDAITIMDELRLIGTRDIDTLRTYIMRLLEITPTAANVLEYAQIVKDLSILRAVAHAAGEITELVGEAAGNAQGILDAAEQKIYAIRGDNTGTHMQKLSEVFVDIYAELDALAEHPDELPGLPSGYRELDSYINGLMPSNLIVVAANVGVGKTSIVLNMATAAAKASKKSVAFFSLEMANTQLGMRLLSSESGIDNKKLTRGSLNPEEWTRIAAAAAKLSALDIYLADRPTMTILEMKSQCRRIPNLGLIVIDYLQLIQSPPGRRNDNREQEVGELARSLKIMAKELKVPVICCAQLSRRNTQRPDKRPMLSDLRESGTIEASADNVILLHREAYHDHDSENINDAEMHIAKNRHGDTGIVYLKWDGAHYRYTSIDHAHEKA